MLGRAGKHMPSSMQFPESRNCGLLAKTRHQHWKVRIIRRRALPNLARIQL